MHEDPAAPARSPGRPGWTSQRWWTIALRGVAAVVLGLLSLALPRVTFLSLVILFGIYAILDGILTLSLIGRGGYRWNSIGARGVASILAGLIALVWPGITAVALLLVIASWAIVAGGLEILLALRLRHRLRHEGVLVLEGVLSIAFGSALFIAPSLGMIALGLWVGAFALVTGALLIAVALSVRRHRDEPAGSGLAAA